MKQTRDTSTTYLLPLADTKYYYSVSIKQVEQNFLTASKITKTEFKQNRILKNALNM